MKNALVSLFFFLFFLVLNSYAQGELWGTTYIGGQSNLGVIFKTDATGNNQVVKKEFSTMFPGSSRQIKLCQATLTTGKLYGVGGGGANEKGIIYEFNPTNNEYLKKRDLDGYIAFRLSLTQAPNGKLYGMTYDGGVNNLGTLFEYDPASNTYLKRVDFDGANGKSPSSSLTLGANGKLYGLAEGGAINNYGVLFEYDPITNIFTKKIDFDGTSGNAPFNGINQAANGKLYGYAVGVIFEYDPIANVVLKKVDQSVTNGNSAGSGLTQANNGKMYGVNSSNYLTSNSKGNIFEFDPITSSYVIKFEFEGANGNYPNSDLLLASNGKLYGTTNNGGIEDNGVFFEYEPGTSSSTKLFEFTVNTGTYPWGSLMQATNGKLYGITGNGGPGLGVIFEFDLTSNIYSRKIDFSASSEGILPIYCPMQASNGKLYGYTYAAGENGFGTLYEYNLLSDSFIKRYDFNSSLSYPKGKLVEALSGFLFGSSGLGGINKKGAIFKFDINSNTVTTVFSFDGSNTGNFPNSLTVGANGKIYGTCGGGGANDTGTIFEFDPASNSLTKKIDLDFVNGGSPSGALIQVSNGNFYGLAGSGGGVGSGTLFEYKLTANTYSKLIDFDSNKGTYFPGDLVEWSSGILFGFAGNEGANGKGTLFEYNLSTNTFTKKVDFDGVAKGANPYGSLAKSSNNKLYGLTTNGGTTDNGTLFEFDPATGIFTKKLDFDGANGSKPIYAQLLYVAPRQSQIVTFNTLPTKKFGDANFNLNATSTSGLSVTYKSSNPLVAAITGNIVTVVGVGSATITASQEGNINYNPAIDVEQTLIVNKASQTIAFGTLASKTFGDASFNVSASSSSGLTVNFSSSNTSVATVNGNVVTIVGGGSTDIIASQAGNGNYNSATNVTRILQVNKANQSITLSTLSAKTIGDASFALSATSSSALPVSFRTTTPTKISISGNQVSISSAGQATIIASQSGSASFNAAAEVSQSFCINPAKPTITVTNPNTDSPTLISSATSGNQWFKDGVALSGATNATLTVNSSGVYSVESIVETCKGPRSNDLPLIVTGDISTQANELLEISPNPTKDAVIFKLPGVERKYISIFDANGRSMEFASTEKSEIEIDVRSYSFGYYLVKVKTSKGLYYGKFVKN